MASKNADEFKSSPDRHTAGCYISPQEVYGGGGGGGSGVSRLSNSNQSVHEQLHQPPYGVPGSLMLSKLPITASVVLNICVCQGLFKCSLSAFVDI